MFPLLHFMRFVVSSIIQTKLQNKAREVFTKPHPEEVLQDEKVDAKILVENEIEKPKKETSGK